MKQEKCGALIKKRRIRKREREREREKKKDKERQEMKRVCDKEKNI